MIDLVHRHILPAAYMLLPPQMNSPAATAMLLAIGLQESKFVHRHQIGGPAKSFWQFERGGGLVGVMTHPVTGPYVKHVLRELRYDEDSTSAAVHGFMADNDILAAALARLLLWTVPGRLPTANQSPFGWRVYVDGWRPGKPHPETWNPYFARAWRMTQDD